MNGRPSIHVHPCNSIRSSTASGSKRSTMTIGAPQLTESRKVKRPVPCTIGHALSAGPGQAQRFPERAERGGVSRPLEAEVRVGVKYFVGGRMLDPAETPI